MTQPGLVRRTDVFVVLNFSRALDFLDFFSRVEQFEWLGVVASLSSKINVSLRFNKDDSLRESKESRRSTSIHRNDVFVVSQALICTVFQFSCDQAQP